MRTTRYSHALLLLGLVGTIGRAATQATDPNEVDFTQTAELIVKLTDQQGQPVVGGHVMPYAMRMVELGGHGFWPRDVIGPPETAISGADGIATIRYPVHVKAGTRVLSTRLVTFSVKHSDFVQTVVHFDLGPDQAAVILKPGCEVSIRGVDASGHAVRDFAVMVAGPSGADMWADDGEGGRRTRAMNDGTWQTMLVKVQEDGPTLFSDLFPLRVRPSQSVRLRNIELRAGARLVGKLSRNMPRPVAGYVVGISVPSPAEDSWNDENPSLAWHDWAEVDADGSFELESIPRGGQIQLIAVCDGWISTTTVPDARTHTMGQLFPVEEDELSVLVEMEPTGSLEVKLLTEDGQPFTQGWIGAAPNQRYWKDGSTLLGQRYRSEVFVRNQFRAPNKQLSLIDRTSQFPYNSAVGDDGTVMLTGLPVGRNLGIVLQHDRFHLAGEGERHRVRFKLQKPETMKMQVTVVPGL